MREALVELQHPVAALEPELVGIDLHQEPVGDPRESRLGRPLAGRATGPVPPQPRSAARRTDRHGACCAGSVMHSHPTLPLLSGLATRVAPTDLSVLILGETGVGKEVWARRIHALSRRSGQ